MKRLAIGIALVLVFATSAMAAGYKLSTIRLDDFGTSETRFTADDGTFTNRFYLSPSFNTYNGQMAIGESGVTITHGYVITHVMAIHGTGLVIETGGMWEQFDLNEFFVICNESSCGLSINYLKQE